MQARAFLFDLIFMAKIIGKKIIHCKEINSTNDEARRLIREGMGEGVVIIADRQTKGRGKPGSVWFSPPGVGVYLSAVIKPFKNPKDLAPITGLGARAVVSTIKKMAGLEPKVKPPNDVLLNGKKLCGVLVEGLASGYLIIGIGININNPISSFPEEIRNSATSLKIESNKSFDIQEFADILVSELDKEYLAYLARI